jgi:hypothetical protein
MIMVDGAYHCVVEYLDAHLGGNQIKDIVPGEPDAQPTVPTLLVFTDGHTLPILCPDCGEAHSMGMDPDEFLEDMAGLYLIGFSYLPPEDDEPEGIELILSEDEELDPQDADEDNSDTLFVHLLSVQQLTCPDGEPGADDQPGAEDQPGADDDPGAGASPG